MKTKMLCPCGCGQNMKRPLQKRTKSINIKIQSTPIVASVKKLQVRWTAELAQDLNAYHGIDEK
jgi:hypothetical protein